MTRVAVMIPTRNRADLVEAAIRSALESPSDEVRVVVSDNSTSDEDRVRLTKFCASFGDGRLELIRPPESLSMTRHWNWAIDHILGDAATTHVLILTDRTIFKPGALDEVLRVVRDFPDDVIIYNDDKIVDDQEPVALIQQRWSGVVVRVSSMRLLQMTSQMQLHPAPRMMNSVVPRAVFDRVRAKFGAVFGSASPDFCFAYRCLYVVDSILYFDRAPVVHYALTVSNGFAFVRGERSATMDDYLATIGESVTGYAPIPEIVTANNAVVHEYCRVRAETKSDKFPPVDHDRYMQMLAADIARMRDGETRKTATDLLNAHGGVSRKPPSLLRLLQRVLSLPAAPATRPAWSVIARAFRINPPGDAPITFRTRDDAIAHLRKKPRRRHITSLHLRVLFGAYEEVARY